MISDLFSGSPFKLCSLDKSSSFSEYLLTFWQKKMFCMHLVPSLPTLELATSSRRPGSIMENSIWKSRSGPSVCSLN